MNRVAKKLKLRYEMTPADEVADEKLLRELFPASFEKVQKYFAIKKKKR